MASTFTEGEGVAVLVADVAIDVVVSADDEALAPTTWTRSSPVEVELPAEVETEVAIVVTVSVVVIVVVAASTVSEGVLVAALCVTVVEADTSSADIVCEETVCVVVDVVTVAGCTGRVPLLAAFSPCSCTAGTEGVKTSLTFCAGAPVGAAAALELVELEMLALEALVEELLVAKSSLPTTLLEFCAAELLA
jgi:hypothetical protein